jgi:hypothetical protein
VEYLYDTWNITNSFGKNVMQFATCQPDSLHIFPTQSVCTDVACRTTRAVPYTGSLFILLNAFCPICPHTLLYDAHSRICTISGIKKKAESNIPAAAMLLCCTQHKHKHKPDLRTTFPFPVPFTVGPTPTNKQPQRAAPSVPASVTVWTAVTVGGSLHAKILQNRLCGSEFDILDSRQQFCPVIVNVQICWCVCVCVRVRANVCAFAYLNRPTNHSAT